MAREDIDIMVRLRGARAAAAEARGVEGSVRGIGTTARRTGSDTSKATKGMTAGLLGLRNMGISVAGALGFGGGAGLAFALKSMIDESRQGKKANADTAAAIKSMGNVAGITATQVGDLATQLSVTSGIDDDVIQLGINKLLTFSEIRNRKGRGNDIFTQTTKTAVDFAARFDQSVNTSFVQLGKALQDPTKGLTKLTRTGVSFTDQEQKKIKALQQSGDLLGAQRIMLRSIEQQTKGAARAKADPFDRLRTSAKALAQVLGDALMPFLTKAANATAKFVDQMRTGTGTGGRFVARLSSIWQFLKRNRTALLITGAAIVTMVAAYKTVKTAVTVVRTLSTAIKGIKAASRAVRGTGTFIVDQIIPGVRRAPARIGAALSRARDVLKRVLGRAGTAGGTAAADNAATAAGSQITPKINSKAGRFRTAGRLMGSFIGAAAATVAVGLIVDQVDKALVGSNNPNAANPSLGKKRSAGQKASTGLSVTDFLGGFKIPGFASGGTVRKGPVQLVGERGPELVSLPAGSHVTPNESGLPLMNHVNVYIDGRLVTKSVERTLLNQMARA